MNLYKFLIFYEFIIMVFIIPLKYLNIFILIVNLNEVHIPLIIYKT